MGIFFLSSNQRCFTGINPLIIGSTYLIVIHMKTKASLCIVLAFAFSKVAVAIEQNASGEQIYKEVCFICHTPGVANAPKLGDKAAWGKLISEGQVIITAHGYVGIRAMPARGGKQELSVEQFAEALNYIVRKSGGHWASPNKAMLEEINKEIAIRKKTQ